ncbi:hypothetical protein LPJ61_000911 [Coemansia biformis]|uniref:Uncharacterized protein n=1 Tax=Coemansia biformis TaxID=1286918 RepID=A0A9W8D0L6_9FUNG|nr:hypothetical protein LPJ61_000911 [Coemansia biformis]
MPRRCAEISVVFDGLNEEGPSWEQVEQALSRYAECIRQPAPPRAARRTGLYAEDNTTQRRQGKHLVRTCRIVGDAVAIYAEGCLRRGENARAASALSRVLAVDGMHDPGFMLSAITIDRLLERQADGSRMTQTNEALLEAVPVAARLPENVLHSVVAAMFRHKCHFEVGLWAPHLSGSNISAAIAEFMLRSLRERQRSIARPPTSRRRELSVDEFLGLAGTCEFNRQARRVVRLLRRRSAGSVTAGHLAKALEIELASVPPEWRLPRTVDLWLREFRRCRIDPGAQPLLAIASAYRSRGDPQFAQQVLAQMMDTPAEAVPGRTVVDAAPHAHSTAALGHVLADFRARGRAPPAPLVTSTIAWLVDSGDVPAAEQLWRDYGCECAMPRGGKSNVRALAKLVQGYARASHVEKAAAFFQVVCQNEAAGNSAGCSAYLTGLLNTVLRSSIHTVDAGGPSTARYDLLLLRLAVEHGVPLDVATYNVLFAGFSRAAQVQAQARPDGLAAAQLSKIARAMRGLYEHMCQQGIVPNDVTVAHLLPLWVFLGRADLAAVLWEQCVYGRTRHKSGQIRIHALAQARRWNVEDRLRPLLGTR